MLKIKLPISLLLTITILVAQVGTVFAAPTLQESSPISGIVQSITLETDVNTGITTVLVRVLDENDLSQIARVSQETAIRLGLVTRDADGNPVINNSVLGQAIEVEPATVIPDKEVNEHPVGNALATFFADFTGINYDQIMAAHNKGTGFGVIAQALWLTMKFDGDSEVFLAILEAKETGDYSAFLLDDGTTPENWGQLRKAILDSSGKKDSAGVVISNKHKNKNKDNNRNNNGNGNGGENNNGNENGNNSGNENNQEKDKDKDNKGNGNGQDKDKNKDKNE